MLKVNRAEYHRNGIAGCGFIVALFHDSEHDGQFISVLFPEPGHVAVINLARLAEGKLTGVEGNAWRGDYYEDDLRALADKWITEHPPGWAKAKSAPQSAKRKGKKVR